MRAINASIMRAINRRMILDQIRLRPISRAELSEITHLTRASVTQIVEELMNEGIVVESKVVGRMRLGRRSTQLDIPPNAGVFFGVHLSGARISVGCVNMRGEVLKHNMVVPAARSSTETMNAIAATIDHQRRGISLPLEKLQGIGVSIIGGESSVEMKHEIQEALAKRCGLPVVLEYDVNARALDEKYFGCAKDNFALIHLGEKISASVIANGSLYRGAEQGEVQIDRMATDANLTQGTLNDWLGEAALLQGTGCQSWEELMERATEEGASTAVERLQQYLAFGIVNIVHAFHVPHVVLCGEVFSSGDFLEQELYDKVLQNGIDKNQLSIQIQRESNPVRIGASPAYHRFFQGGLED